MNADFMKTFLIHRRTHEAMRPYLKQKMDASAQASLKAMPRQASRLYLFFLICVICVICGSSRAQQIITAKITITNAAAVTNGQTITVNAATRTFTNLVTSPSTQILTPTNSAAAITNLFFAYSANPAPNANLSWNGTNMVQFKSFPGVALTASVSSGWAIVALSTNTLTAATVVRVPPAAVSLVEQTNTANGLVLYLSSDGVTNVIPVTAPAFAAIMAAVADATGITILKTNINANGFSVTNANIVGAITIMQGGTNLNAIIAAAVANIVVTNTSTNVISTHTFTSIATTNQVWAHSLGRLPIILGAMLNCINTDSSSGMVAGQSVMIGDAFNVSYDVSYFAVGGDSTDLYQGAFTTATTDARITWSGKMGSPTSWNNFTITVIYQ